MGSNQMAVTAEMVAEYDAFQEDLTFTCGMLESAADRLREAGDTARAELLEQQSRELTRDYTCAPFAALAVAREQVAQGQQAATAGPAFQPQPLREQPITDATVSAAFARLVLRQALLPQFAGYRDGRPRALVIGGQPGAGKTWTRSVLAPPGSYVAVNGDNFRRFHPQYHDVLAAAPEQMPEFTAPVSGPMLAAAIGWLLDQRIDATWETTFRSTDALMRDLRAACDAGYDVELVAVTVAPTESLLTTVLRWLRQIPVSGFGRLVSLTGHDEPVAAAVSPLQLVRSELPGVTVRVVSRDGVELGRGDEAAQALVAGQRLTADGREQLLAEAAQIRAEVASLGELGEVGGVGGVAEALAVLAEVTRRAEADEAS